MNQTLSTVTNSVKKSLLLASVAMAVAMIGAGCSQDPYSGQPESVRNGQVPDKKTEKPTGAACLGDACAIIDAPRAARFIEGQENELTIIGRVLQPINGQTPVLGRDFELSIDNISDFPGASFDAMTGKFKWKPDIGFVDSAKTQNAQIEVTLTTKAGVIMHTYETILVEVTRAMIVPEIVSIEDLAAVPTREGEIRTFQVTVRDTHGDDSNKLYLPKLTIIPADSGSGTSAANFMYCQPQKTCSSPTRDPNNKNQFIFKVAFDLRTAEVTTGRTNMTFAVQATSRFGEQSDLKTGNATVLTSIKEPVVSWASGDVIEVVAGQENSVTFTVADLLSESDMSVTFNSRCDLVLGANSTCACKPASTGPGPAANSNQLCTIRWRVPMRTLQTDFSLDFTAFSRSRFEQNQKQFPFSRRLRVVQPPVTLNDAGAN